MLAPRAIVNPSITRAHSQCGDARTIARGHGVTRMKPADPWISNSEQAATLLWTVRGVRCVVKRYDETRYQLRLLRAGGTIKADLFSNHAAAVSASHLWRQQFKMSRAL